MSGMVFQREISIREGRFLREFCDLCDGPRGRLVRDLFRGIRRSGRTLLTEISRALGEDIDLIYTEKRLSRELGSPRFDVAGEKVAARMLERVAGRVRADEVIAVDVSDLAKPYARAMEDLCVVWDGSNKAATRGYWLYESYHVDAEGQPRVLQWYPYSTRSCDFLSANSEFMEQLELLMEALGGRGILVMDRGCDRRGLYDDLLEREVQWVIRQRGNRDVIGPGGRRKLVRQWAEEIVPGGRGAGFMEVKLPGSEVPLWLVASRRREEEEPLMLLCRLRGWAHIAWRARAAYRQRWRAEDAMRAAKQGLKLEEFLVRSMYGIRGLVRMAALVMGFVGELIATSGRVCKCLLEMPHRLPKAVKVVLQPLITALRYVEVRPP